LSFCQQRGIPTEGIRLSQNMKMNPATHLVSQVEIDVRLPEGFTEQYRPALIRAAELCAVKKHLQAPPSISVTATTVRAEVPVG
ncbi:MAG: OsmC family protein, partial [Chloroflexota bacterium]